MAKGRRWCSSKQNKFTLPPCCSTKVLKKKLDILETKNKIKSYRNWIIPTHIGERDLYTVYQFKCYSLPGIPLQTHPEIIFYHISGHLLAQWSWHIKLTITMTKCNLSLRCKNSWICANQSIWYATEWKEKNIIIYECRKSIWKNSISFHDKNSQPNSYRNKFSQHYKDHIWKAQSHVFMLKQQTIQEKKLRKWCHSQ